MGPSGLKTATFKQRVLLKRTTNLVRHALDITITLMYLPSKLAMDFAVILHYDDYS